MEKDLTALMDEFDLNRAKMADVVDKTDPGLEIFPGWTIREVIINLASWEIVINKALKAYQVGDPPYFLHEQDFDIFNQESIETRSSRSMEEVLKEWKQVRADLNKTIKKLKDTDLPVEMVLPWGSERPIYELLEIIGEHETEHMEDIKRVAG
jgi:hypothetical protein